VRPRAEPGKALVPNPPLADAAGGAPPSLASPVLYTGMIDAVDGRSARAGQETIT